MSNIFNILDFGALPDGETDSTAAIQTALDRAGECMGEVVVPPGIYKTGRLVMRPQTKLSGTSSWLFGGYGGSIFRLNTADTDCMIDVTGAFGVQISGMNLEGMRLGQGIHGVKLYWPVYNGGGKEDTPTIDDCKIGHFTGDGVHLEHIWCFSVRHSMLCFNAGAGLYIDGWDGFILDNWFSGNANGGILGGPVCCSVTTTGNRVEWNRVGGFVIPAGNTMNITGNYFDRSGGPALKLGAANGGMESVTVTGNLINRSGKPGP
ncbi:MAG: right-handed parallel beta-helix repeat-containing protein, partial [Clostridia bacterium]|nr:right-handed parallel beta-helix repeat-containing protein [Clostridia bacterium]